MPANSLEKGTIVGAKPALSPEARLVQSDEVPGRRRRLSDLVLFNIAIDSKLRGCDPEKRTHPVMIQMAEASGLAPASQRVSTRWVANSIGTASVTR
jgi:hypothetical protein